jgi:hypothetical protein
VTDPTISIHALTGIQPRSVKTMQVYVDINSTRLRALIDSGLRHNFIDLEAAARAGIALHDHPSLRVVVANGDRLSSSGSCRRLPIAIGGEGFVIECYGLALGSYEMVLGVQWLEALGSVLWDFNQRTLTRVKDGRLVLWTAIDAAPSLPKLMSTLRELMTELLQRFDDLFAASAGSQPPNQVAPSDGSCCGAPISLCARPESRIGEAMWGYAAAGHHQAVFLDVLDAGLAGELWIDAPYSFYYFQHARRHV